MNPNTHYRTQFIEALTKDIDIALQKHPLAERLLYSTIINTLAKVSAHGINDNAKIITINESECRNIILSRNRYLSRYYNSFKTEFTNYIDNNDMKGKFLKPYDNSKIMELNYLIDEWKKNATSSSSKKTFESNVYTHLIDFPLFHKLPEKKQQALYIKDIEYNVCRLCNLNKFKNFVQLSPNMLGVFNGDSLNKHYSNKAHDYSGFIEHLNNEQYSLDMIPELSNDIVIPEQPVPMNYKNMFFLAEKQSNFPFDVRSYNLISYIMTSIYTNLLNDVTNNEKSSRLLNGSVQDLVRVIDPQLIDNNSNLSTSFYIQRAVTYLFNIRKFEYSKITETSYGKSYVIDSLEFRVTTNENGGSQLFYTILVGDSILRSILNGSFFYIYTVERDRLTNDIAKILYATIRQDRIGDEIMGIHHHTYDYISLYTRASCSGTKQENFEKYRQAFADIMEKIPLFERVNCDCISYTIYVTWKPLADSERQELYTTGSTDIEKKIKEIIQSWIPDELPLIE